MARSSFLVCNETKLCEKIMDYTWKIQDILTSPVFLSCGKYKLPSEIILIGNAAFRMKVFLNTNVPPDFSISLELTERADIQIRDYESIALSSDVVEVACYLAIIDKNGLHTCPKWTSLSKDSVATVNIVTSAYIQYDNKTRIPGGCLTIVCEMFSPRMAQKISVEERKVTMHCNDMEKLSQDFENLLSSEKTKFDVFFQVKGERIGAHLNILSARSPVFASMLENRAPETSDRRIKIEDISAESFTYLLRYIYSGKLEDIKMKHASLLTELYAAAAKYSQTGLKNICSSVILKSLSEDNIEDYALLASKYKDSEMMYAVTDYIVKHNEIIDSDVWKKIILKQPDFEHQVLRAFCKKVK